MYINETCEHYCGDEDCAKCDKYGILTGGCAGCEENKDDKEEEERLSIWAN